MRTLLLVLTALFLLTGCETVSDLKDEMSFTAKPKGGIMAVIPPSKAYAGIEKVTLWKSVQAVLDEQRYTYIADMSSGRIKTDPKTLDDSRKYSFSNFSAVVTIRVDGSEVTYMANFNRASSLMLAETGVVYPEKENELRQAFFKALDAKVAPAQQKTAERR